MPRTHISLAAIESIKKIVASKETLFKKALGSDSLPIDITEDKICFPWFTLTGDDGEADAYARFVNAICEMAKRQRRITAREREVSNDKFTMRTFLIRLGFVGSEYKQARKILLRNLTGNSAFKNGQPERESTPVTAESGEFTCLNCGYQFHGTAETDELGLHSYCPKCNSSFDV